MDQHLDDTKARRLAANLASRMVGRKAEQRAQMSGRRTVWKKAAPRVEKREWMMVTRKVEQRAQ
jgi:hypothetical protein